MKKSRKNIPALFALILFLSPLCHSCQGSGENWIVDWAPVSLFITVNDSAGNDLLNPDSTWMDLDSIKMSFLGYTFPLDTTLYMKSRHERVRYDSTKAYRATMFGLLLIDEYMIRLKYDTCYTYLYFGEIDGAVDLDTDLILTWPDHTCDTFHYHCWDHVEGRNPSCERTLTYKGGTQDPSCIVPGTSLIHIIK